MSTHATIGFISAGGSVKTIDLVMDGYYSEAGLTLLMNYNSRNAALLLTSLGTLSQLNDKLQDCITHAVHFKREMRKPNEFESVNDLLSVLEKVAHEYVYLFDEREYKANNEEEYRQYNYSQPSTVNPAKCYWYTVNRDKKLESLQDVVLRETSETDPV